MTMKDDYICITRRHGMPVSKDFAILIEGHDPDLPHAGYHEEDEWVSPGTSGQDMLQPGMVTEGAWKVLLLNTEGFNVNLVVPWTQWSHPPSPLWPASFALSDVWQSTF